MFLKRILGLHKEADVKLKSEMKRFISFFVIAGMLVSLTGCEGDDPVDKIFTYTASAGSGGTISPDGPVSINQDENMAFIATPENDKIVSEWIVNGAVVATSGNSYTLTNVQSNGTIQVTFKDYIVFWSGFFSAAVLDDKGVLTISATETETQMPVGGVEEFPDGSWSYISNWIKDGIDYRDKILSVVIEGNFKNISSEAFSWCTSLTSVTISNSVKEIGLGAFMACSSLTSITIPNSVTSLVGYTFFDCTALTSITIPSSVTYLGSNVLNGCTGLKEVKVGWMTPPSTGIINFFSSATLYVPTGTKALYQAAPVWNNYFATIVEY